MKRFGAALWFAAIAIAANTCGSSAQGAMPVYRIGDRVEVYGIAKPEIGIIREFGSGIYQQCYRVVFESSPAEHGDGMWICPHNDPKRMIVLGHTGNAPARNAPIAGAAHAEPAAGAGGQFHAGDRAQEYLGGAWRSGTITGPLEHNAYPFVRDDMAGKGFTDQVVPESLRPLGDGSKKPRVAVAPKPRSPVRCPAPTPGTSGPPSTALAHRLIQCVWEDIPSDSTVVNFDIHSMHVDAPRRFVVGSDMGEANQNTIVYPVRATWTKKTFSSSQVVILEEQGMHKCYVDLGRMWVCGYENSRLLRPMQTVLR